MGSIIKLTPENVSSEIPTSLLPESCGPVSAIAYRENKVRPLVWLIFGGTGALGKQISKLAIARRDKVMIAALDEEYDPQDWSTQDEFHSTESQTANNNLKFQEKDLPHSEKMASSMSNGESKYKSSGTAFGGYGYYYNEDPYEENESEMESVKTESRKKRAHTSPSLEPPSKAQRKSSSSENKKRKRPEPFLYIGSEFKDSCRRVKCDVRIRSSVDEAVQSCLKFFGRIDVVANCFGYGVVGACEDQVDSEIRSQFEVNFMGLFHTLRAVLPYLTNAARMDNKSTKPSAAQVHGDLKSQDPTITGTPGHIISFTSSMGVLGAPGFGPYSATRWAAEGLLESLAIEVEHLGCKVTIIETGYAKSGDSEDLARVARPTGIFDLSNTSISSHFVMKSLSSDYQDTPAEYGVQFTKHLDKILATSTVKVAAIIWEIGHCQSPPLRLLLGSCGVLGMKDKLRGMAEEIEDWKFLYDEQDKVRTENIFA